MNKVSSQFFFDRYTHTHTRTLTNTHTHAHMKDIKTTKYLKQLMTHYYFDYERRRLYSLADHCSTLCASSTIEKEAQENCQRLLHRLAIYLYYSLCIVYYNLLSVTWLHQRLTGSSNIFDSTCVSDVMDTECRLGIDKNLLL